MVEVVKIKNNSYLMSDAPIENGDIVIDFVDGNPIVKSGVYLSKDGSVWCSGSMLGNSSQDCNDANIYKVVMFQHGNLMELADPLPELKMPPFTYAGKKPLNPKYGNQQPFYVWRGKHDQEQTNPINPKLLHSRMRDLAEDFNATIPSFVQNINKYSVRYKYIFAPSIPMSERQVITMMDKIVASLSIFTNILRVEYVTPESSRANKSSVNYISVFAHNSL